MVYYHKMLTRKQKETLVIELYQQGKIFVKSQRKYICRLVAISEIINRFEGVEFEGKVPLSKETKALKLFSEGKDLVYVAINLT